MYRPSRKLASVHYSNYRYEEAKKQLSKKPTSIDEIIKLVNDYLIKVDIKVSEKNLYDEINKLSDLYKCIKEKENLNNKRHIIWMKFTKDGYLGVVAKGADINFQIPESEKEYDNKKGSRWEYNTSGIIIHKLKKEWNEEFVLIFPLPDVNNKIAREMEKKIGDYLIENNVAILDFYSHRY